MNKSILLIILLITFQGCATWYGIKKDSKDAWKATKETTGEVYDSTKKAIHEATEDNNLELDRKKLGELIFNNEDKRKKLNKIMHPTIRNEVLKRIFLNYLFM